MPRKIISTHEFMNLFSISRSNFEYLVQSKELIPFEIGNQTFLDLDSIDLMIENAIMLAEMKAGFHQPRTNKKPHKK